MQIVISRKTYTRIENFIKRFLFHILILVLIIGLFTFYLASLIELNDGYSVILLTLLLIFSIVTITLSFSSLISGLIIITIESIKIKD